MNKYDIYLHELLMENDDYYRQLDESEQEIFRHQISNTLIGIRTKIGYYVNKILTGERDE